MMQCLNKYGLAFQAVLPSEELQYKMPLWHHPGEDGLKKQTNNGAKAKCMRSKHAILTVGAGVALMTRLQDPLHSKSASCPCDACDDDKEKGCKDPHACAEGAERKINQLHPEWIP
ncbi:hypothetical protein B0H12DRAFT_1001194, partial [Mycena haematopus]